MERMGTFRFQIHLKDTFMNRVHSLLIASLITATVGAAQGTLVPDKPYGTLFFKAQIGSFKVLPGGNIPAQGKLEFSCNGTFLVSRLRDGGTVKTTGTIRKEYEHKGSNKQVYFGKGTVVIEGKFDAVQFFGREIDAKFYGFGFVRVYGEFDKNLNTGEYWYEGEKHHAWGTSGMALAVPNPEGAPTKPSIRRVGG